MHAFLFERHEALGRGGQGGLHGPPIFFFFSKQTFLKVKFEWIAPNLCWAVLKIILKKIITHFTRASVPYLFICYILACQYSQ